MLLQILSQLQNRYLTYLFILTNFTLLQSQWTLGNFLNKDPNNLIMFWDCPDSIKWSLYLMVNKELKCCKIDPILLSKTSWKFSWKEECNSIIHRWQITFQAMDHKERNFLYLNNDKEQHIWLNYSKKKVWLKYFGLLNSICVYIMRLITNHTPIGKYRLRFFTKESISCLYKNYPIEMRRYILFKCPRYNKCWNPKRVCCS